jgi:hypothetical protein
LKISPFARSLREILTTLHFVQLSVQKSEAMKRFSTNAQFGIALARENETRDRDFLFSSNISSTRYSLFLERSILEARRRRRSKLLYFAKMILRKQKVFAKSTAKLMRSLSHQKSTC